MLQVCKKIKKLKKKYYYYYFSGFMHVVAIDGQIFIGDTMLVTRKNS